MLDELLPVSFIVGTDWFMDGDFLPPQHTAWSQKLWRPDHACKHCDTKWRSVLCPAVCISDVINKTGMYDKSVDWTTCSGVWTLDPHWHLRVQDLYPVEVGQEHGHGLCRCLSCRSGPGTWYGHGLCRRSSCKGGPGTWALSVQIFIL